MAIPNGTGVLLLAPDNTVGGTAAGSGNLISGNTSHGISLGPPNATGNIIAGNHIGVDATGTMALGNDIGVWVDNVADNVIGGTSAGARNVISGNREGITLWDAGSHRHPDPRELHRNQCHRETPPFPTKSGFPSTVRETPSAARRPAQETSSPGTPKTESTFMGSLPPGTCAGESHRHRCHRDRGFGEWQSWYRIIFASANTIGGTAAGAGNVISGNGFTGVFLLGPDTEENVILGNFIGTDLTGTSAVGNFDSGVAIHSATQQHHWWHRGRFQEHHLGQPQWLDRCRSGSHRIT